MSSPDLGSQSGNTTGPSRRTPYLTVRAILHDLDYMAWVHDHFPRAPRKSDADFKSDAEFLSGLEQIALEDLHADDRSCSICFDPYVAPSEGEPSENRERAVKLPCGHVIGQSCLSTLLHESHNCPMCRSDFFNRTPPESEFMVEHDMLSPPGNSRNEEIHRRFIHILRSHFRYPDDTINQIVRNTGYRPANDSIIEEGSTAHNQESRASGQPSASSPTLDNLGQDD